MKLVLEDNGTVKGHAEVESKGLYGLFARSMMTTIPQGVEAQVVGNVLAKTGQNGSGSFTRGKPQDLANPHHYSSDFTLPNHVQLPGPGAFVIPQGFGSAFSIATTFDQMGLMQRKLPALLSGRRIEETTTLQLPKAVKPTTLPKDVQLTWAHGSYESKVKAEGSTVTINRVFILDLPEPLLKPEEYAEFRTFGQAVIKDLRSQFIY